MRSPFEHVRPLILASSSPRRQAFLRDQGLEFSVVAPVGPEPSPAPGEDPAAYALRAAAHKARAVPAGAGREAGAAATGPLVLAADTIVVAGGDILGKPASEDHALAMLTRLAGNTHTVITACCLRPIDAKPICFADRTRVTFAAWPETLLRAYIATGEPMDKAGAYGIQDKGAFLVERIEGSWSTVVGLPMSRTLSALLALGVIRFRAASA